MSQTLRCLALGLLLFSPLLAQDGADRDELIARRRRLELQMSRERQRLLRENAELRTLNERILSLQKELVRRLEQQPEMARLRQELNATEAALAP